MVDAEKREQQEKNDRRFPSGLGERTAPNAAADEREGACQEDHLPVGAPVPQQVDRLIESRRGFCGVSENTAPSLVNRLENMLLVRSLAKHCGSSRPPC